MLILTSLISAWHESIHQHMPAIQSRSYADDLSATVSQKRKTDLQENIRQLHQSTQNFAASTGLKINNDKTFTFGDPALKNLLPSIPVHKETFRLTGGVVKVTQQQCWTDLEKQRASKWTTTTRAVRTLPVGWFTKVKILQQGIPQLHWGHGTHRLALDRDQLRTMRANVVWCLLNKDEYCASPLAIFAIIAPPSLDPEFCLHANALRLMQRANQSPEDIESFARLIASTSSKHDGPAARAKQLREHPAFQEATNNFLNGVRSTPNAQHLLRESWRNHIWHNLARDRPQAFSGAQRGINKNLTISLLNSWAKQADHLQEQIDNNSIAPPDSFADPRPRQKILRLLLTAGLLNPEANHRHRKLKGTIKCKCGASPTHHHITWDCPLFQEYRLPALQALTKPIEDFPVCFQYCTLVPMNMEITKKASSYHSG